MVVTKLITNLSSRPPYSILYFVLGQLGTGYKTHHLSPVQVAAEFGRYFYKL